jgi:hypothetical protein
MVHLPARRSSSGRSTRPEGGRSQSPPIYQPEMAARAIVAAALHPDRREVWVGLPTVKAIVVNKFAPGLLDRYLAKRGYSGQLTDEPIPADAPANLFKTADGDYGAHGRFDDQARAVSMQAVAGRHRVAVALGLLGLGFGVLALLVWPYQAGA